MVFQIILIIFSAFAIIKTWRQHNNQQVSLYWAFSWSLLWTLVICVAIAPQETDDIAAFFGIGRGSDLFIYSAIIFLLYGFYRIMIRLEKQQQELTELVRKIAINNAKKKD